MTSDVVAREIFWNISPPGRRLFYALALLAMGIFAYGVWRQVRKVLRAKPRTFPGAEIRTGVWRRLREILLNSTVARDPLAGVMHRFIMWGFIALFIGTVLVGIEYDVFQVLLGRPHGFLVGPFYLSFELVLDVMGMLFLVGLVVALLRRYGMRVP